VQAVPQVIPAGLDVTVPLPVPALSTVSTGVVSVNVAVTFLAVVIETVHVAALPVQPPPDQLKVEPVAGVAVSTTLSSAANKAEQVVPQLMPAGAEVTVPVPLPALVTFRA
jgi:hypothetical protein